MREKEFNFLVAFLLLCFGFVIIGISEDYSNNLIKEKTQQNQDYTDLKSKQEIYDLKCITLDCAIEKSMK